jgi:hypothetical protein
VSYFQALTATTVNLRLSVLESFGNMSLNRRHRTMNLGKTETRNIETESAIVNDHPASISAVEQMAKGHLYTYFLLTWRSTDGKRLRKHYPTLNKARHALSNLLKKDTIESERQKILRHRSSLFLINCLCFPTDVSLGMTFPLRLPPLDASITAWNVQTAGLQFLQALVITKR